MNQPSFMNKVVGFTVSMKNWVLAGCPHRSPDWVAEIFNEHCRPCPFYKGGRNIFGQRGYCEKCGCHVSADSTNPFNKIVDPNNACPLDPPKWEATIESRQQRLTRERNQP